MSRICFDEMCREVLQCEHYTEWEERSHIRDHGHDYVSDNTWVSCQKVGPSCNIDVYPDDCPHKKALKLYAIEKEEAHKQFLKQCEQEKIWDRLNEVKL